MAPGSKHTIYAFFNLYWNCDEKRTKINKKEAGIGPFFKKLSLNLEKFYRKCPPPQHSIQDVPPTFCCVKLLFENIELSRGSEWWSIIFFKRFNKVQNVAERRFSFCKNDAKSFSNWFKVVDAKLLLHCQRVLNKVALPINLLNLTKKVKGI